MAQVHPITAGDMPWQHVHAIGEREWAALEHADDMDGALDVTLVLEAATRAGVLAQLMEALPSVADEYRAAAMAAEDADPVRHYAHSK